QRISESGHSLAILTNIQKFNHTFFQSVFRKSFSKQSPYLNQSEQSSLIVNPLAPKTLTTFFNQCIH
ncbi:MAG: hypothetical protein P8I62_05585, partial [Pseudomonadales bacterium]|nr:hypothetical protein [Pseudomonadales bacterium]